MAREIFDRTQAGIFKTRSVAKLREMQETNESATDRAMGLTERPKRRPTGGIFAKYPRGGASVESEQ